MKHSVIVTGYNCEKYAKECIVSILGQSHTPHEVLIYNDGSTDRTAEVLQQFANHKNVYIWNNPTNKGALNGRYHFVQQATGDVVSFVGMDDMLAPNALEVVTKHYTENTMMTYGSWVKHGSEGYKQAEEYSDEVFETRAFRRSGWKATALNTFRTELIKKVPKDVLTDGGVFFDNCTDLAYSFPCLEMVTKQQVVIVKQPIYIYRVHGQTTLGRLGKEHKSRVREKLKRIPICKL